MQNNINKFKIDPRDGHSEIWSAREIGEFYGVSANTIYKLLQKFNLVTLVKNNDKQYYKPVDNTLFVECHWNIKTSHTKGYDPVATDDTTNVTIKFTELGKDYFMHLLKVKEPELVTEFDIKFDFNDLNKYFPNGKYALSFRRAGGKYNPNPNNATLIFISNRANRNNTPFSKDYLFIDDKAKEYLSKLFKEFWKNHPEYLGTVKSKSGTMKGYAVPLVSTIEIMKIISFRDNYFNHILNNSPFQLKLSDDQKKYNRELLLGLLSKEEVDD